MSEVLVKSVVAQSTFDYVREQKGPAVWQQVLDAMPADARIAVTAGGNVPLHAMGAFNEAYVRVVCRGSRQVAAKEFQTMGAVSAEKLLLNNGIFSIFARHTNPKQVLGRSETVIKTAYPGATVDVELNADESGGTIHIHGMAGYPYGSQRLVGWLVRGVEIVGGQNPQITERNWDKGMTDSPTYEITIGWDGWR